MLVAGGDVVTVVEASFEAGGEDGGVTLEGLGCPVSEL